MKLNKRTEERYKYESKTKQRDTRTLSTHIFILANGHKKGRNIKKNTKQTDSRIIKKKTYMMVLSIFDRLKENGVFFFCVFDFH